MSARPLSPARSQLLHELHSQPGVTGTLLQRKEQVLAHDLPYSDARVDDLAACIDRVCVAYESVGRPIWQVLAAYEKQCLVVLTREALRLSLVLEPGKDPTAVIARATRLLMALELPPETLQVRDVPPPPEVLAPSIGVGEFRSMLTALMSRVTDHAVVVKLIDRRLAAEPGVNGHVDVELARRIGLDVLEMIPNRSKRATLISEFLATLDS